MQGEIDGAKSIYTEAVDIEAECVEAMYNLGLCQKRLGTLIEALATFKNLSNILPNNVEVLFQVVMQN